MYQTSFCDVNTNKASSGLIEKVILTKLAPKHGGKMDPMDHLSPQHLGNLHTWTNTYIGTTITASPINTVSTTCLHTGPKLSVQMNSFLGQEYQHLKTAISRC